MREAVRGECEEGEEEEVEEEEEEEGEKKVEGDDGRVIMPVISLHENVRAPVLPTNRTRSDTTALLPSILLFSQSVDINTVE